MEKTNLTLGSIKARDVLRDGINFGRRNYLKLLKMSLLMFGVMLLYYLIVFGIVWVGLYSGRQPGNYQLKLVMMMLNVPLSLGGAFLMSLTMVSFIKRVNASVRGEEMTLQESFKGAGITALKIYGVSMLGAIIIYIPLIILVPVGVVLSVVASLAGPITHFAPIIIALMILAITIFSVIFAIWAFYVGIHIYALIIGLIIDSNIRKWFKWSRELVKGRIKNIAGVMAGLYGVYILLGIFIAVPAFLLYDNILGYQLIVSALIMVISLLIYPFIFSTIVILYYRLKAANWEKLSAMTYGEKFQKTENKDKTIIKTESEF